MKRHSGLLILFLAILFVGGAVAGCTGGCPDALLEGTLTERGGELIVRYENVMQVVDWPVSGHRVYNDDGQLVVKNWLGMIVARAGDEVLLGGGESEPGVWSICGQFEVIQADD